MIIELIEYKKINIPRSKIHPEIIDCLRDKYSTQIKVNLQNTIDGDCWQFYAQGWVGYIPVTSNFGIRIKPKVPIQNLLGMLEYAYNLKSCYFLNDTVDCNSLEEFYNRLAAILVNRILGLIRRGLYQTYISKTKQLTYVRGRLNISNIKTWNTKLTCSYKQQTHNNKENQILLWTLHCISRHQLCNLQVRSLVRKAYRALAQSLTLTPYTAKDCSNISYNRLDREYRSIHQLCRFFIDRTMPNYDSGNHQSLPFLIDMAKLYEQFVAEWLKINLPAKYQLKIKETVEINPIKLEIDLLICDRFTGTTLYVLDTKYKTPQKPSNADIYQLVAYATSQKCDRAILIYPQLLPKPLNTYIGEINVRSLTFSLQEDLEKSGMAFIESF